MAISENKIREYNKRLLLSRMRILLNNGFYGLLLMHMIFSLDEACPTAATDGYRIYFGPQFLDEISDSELDTVMLHEILHVALEHCARTGGRDNETFNIACDIVVNSNILNSCDMDISSITLSNFGELMHLAPNGKEGFNYTAEEVYDMLGARSASKKRAGSMQMPTMGDAGENKPGHNNTGGFAMGRAEKKTADRKSANGCWDDHSRWPGKEDSRLTDVWVKRIQDAYEAIENKDGSNSRGTIPMFAKRMLGKLKNSQTDWRTILADFVQEEVCDYSFSPPDRRFDGSPFYLPDFNGTEISVSDILFMIDTSGSVSDDVLTAAYYEIKGAIDQFDGKLRGMLGFFDAAIIEPQPFENEQELLKIKPAGGGGTDFMIVFEYVARYMQDNPPKSIVILTDGYAPFPDESAAGGIPVLWLIYNTQVIPPWGRVATIEE